MLMEIMFKVEWFESLSKCSSHSLFISWLFENFAILTHLRFLFQQSFFAGLAASGALASSPRLITKAALDESEDGPRKGVSMSLFFKIYFTANSFIGQLELLFDT